jgi:hypothetical protein
VKLSAFAAVAVVLMLACGGYAPPHGIAPRDVVAQYYALLSKGDYASARTCLTEEQARLEDQEDGDFHNLKRIRNVAVGQPQPYVGTVPPQFSEVVEVAVTFDAEYYQTITQPSGHVGRFILVGRTRATGEWRIFSIGSGP